MLYGGEVNLSERNYRTVLKFSVVYNVQNMYTLCLDWVTRRLAEIDLRGLIEFGLLIKRVGQGNRDILNLCIGFIGDSVGDELQLVGKDWLIGDNTNLVKFLINEEILYYSLPVLSTWISCNVSDENIKIILTQLEGNNESFWKYGKRSSELLEKMSEIVEVPATMKRLLHLSNLTNRKLVDNPRWSFANTVRETVEPDHDDDLEPDQDDDLEPDQDDDLEPDQGSLDVWVETTKLGRVIGKGGFQIRKIESMYGVRVDIKKDEVQEYDTKVILTGSEEDAMSAKDFIYDLVDAE